LSFVYACVIGTFKKRVAFHATNLASETPPSGTPLVFDNIHSNEGGAYEAVTGYFVVPTAGVYYFIASSGPKNSDSGAHFSLYVDNSQLAWSNVYILAAKEMASVHGVIKLIPGQRVWVKSHGDIYWSDGSAFTGFLFSPGF
jgi:hypothetical protein